MLFIELALTATIAGMMAMSAASKKSRASCTLGDKWLVPQPAKRHLDWDQQAVAEEFNKQTKKNMKRSTVSDIVKKREKLTSLGSAAVKAGAKRQRLCKFPELEHILMEWFRQRCRLNHQAELLNRAVHKP
jgi:hypothetical protein